MAWLRSLVGGVVLAASAFFAYPPLVHSQEPVGLEKKVELRENEIRRAAVNTLRDWYKQDVSGIDPAAIRLERLQIDLDAYNKIITAYSGQPRALSDEYMARADITWHGILDIGGKRYAGLFRIDKSPDAPDFVRAFEPVDDAEERFIRAIKDISDVFPARRHDGSTIAPEYVEEVVLKARGDTVYGPRVTDAVAGGARKALEHAGPNASGFLRAMSQMSPLEAVIALHLLPIMDNQAYGFGGSRNSKSDIVDLETQPGDVFLDNVEAAAAALRKYPWTRDEASRNWDNFVSCVAVPRFSEEHDGPGRMHLHRAVHGLVEDCESLEDAVERICRVSCKLFKYGNPFNAADGNWLDFLLGGVDRCEAMAMFGAKLLRAAGIPACMQHSPWWADRDDNHAWLVVPYTRLDGSLGQYSFLTGDRELLPDGKYNLLTFSKDSLTIPVTMWAGKALRGAPGIAKVYTTWFVPGGMKSVDDTTRYTHTQRLELSLDKVGYAGRTIALAVYNSSGFRAVTAGKVDADGRLVVDDLGCTPLTSEDGRKRVGEGLLYAMVDVTDKQRPRIVGTPFNFAPDGKTTFAKECELAKRPAVVDVQGLQPDTDYRVQLWTVSRFEDLRKVRAGPDGIAQLPVDENTLILCVPTDAAGNPTGHGRPYAIRKFELMGPAKGYEGATIFEAMRH